MVGRIKAKAVLRLDGQGLSGRAMAGSLGIAGQSVSGTPGAAKTAGVGWDDVADRPDDEVYALLFPGRGEREGVCGRPDWAGVRRGLARVGVTLGILHGGYVDGCLFLVKLVFRFSSGIFFGSGRGCAGRVCFIGFGVCRT